MDTKRRLCGQLTREITAATRAMSQTVKMVRFKASGFHKDLSALTPVK